MKALFQELPFENDRYFNVYKEDLPCFVVPWHYHPSIEIMCVVSGTGTRLVGDHMERYEEGDVCMIGPALPHEWRSSIDCIQDDNAQRSTCYCLFFRKELFDGDFIRLPEMKNIRELLEKSRYGIKFMGMTRERLTALIPEIYHTEGVRRILLLFELLTIMSETKEMVTLSTTTFAENIVSEDFDRFDKVFKYIQNNYYKSIRLDDVAEVANMSPGAFCRYFKSHTKKTFVQYLNDLRVSHAKRMLIENKEKIATIGIMVGFNSLSSFFQHFKRSAGITPQEYQKKYVDI